MDIRPSAFRPAGPRTRPEINKKLNEPRKAKSETERYKRTITMKYHNTIKKLTPQSRGLPEKLTGPQLLKKFSVFYGTQRFITVFTRAHHLSLS